MPPPIKVELLPHDPNWSRLADAEKQRLAEAIGPCLLTVHHIGSTAIPGIHAKPILDLMPVISSLAALDMRQREIEALGYEWWGGLACMVGATARKPIGKAAGSFSFIAMRTARPRSNGTWRSATIFAQTRASLPHIIR